MTTRPIVDYIVIAAPLDYIDGPEARAALLERFSVVALDMIYSQYKRDRPKAIVLEPIDWLMTNDPDDVSRHQPEHECATCRAGNDQARAYLVEFPDRWMALGNLHYTEVWS